MKRSLFTLASLLMLTALLFTSCKKDADVSPTPTEIDTDSAKFVVTYEKNPEFNANGPTGTSDPDFAPVYFQLLGSDSKFDNEFSVKYWLFGSEPTADDYNRVKDAEEDTSKGELVKTGELNTGIEFLPKYLWVMVETTDESGFYKFRLDDTSSKTPLLAMSDSEDGLLDDFYQKSGIVSVNDEGDAPSQFSIFLANKADYPNFERIVSDGVGDPRKAAKVLEVTLDESDAGQFRMPVGSYYVFYVSSKGQISSTKIDVTEDKNSVIGMKF